MPLFLDNALGRLVRVSAYLAAGILLVQLAWISYGVFARYVLRTPDPLVTEATALMLVALVFLGLPLAYKSDSIPKVVMLSKLLPRKLSRAVWMFDQLVVLLVGCFIAYMSILATARTYKSGVRSDAAGWPEYVIWFFLAFSCLLFTILVARDLLRGKSDPWNGT